MPANGPQTLRPTHGRLRWQASSYNRQIHRAGSRRSRLAGEEALSPCARLTGAFAGKPAPASALEETAQPR
ncbi:hypothetical protein FCI59_01110 [Pseudomonas protegens]|nr:hypothetical protein [Pseudomonas protegens]